MARDAIGRLKEAKDLDKMAREMMKKDPSNAAKLEKAAQSKRSSAVKQLTRKPKRRSDTPLTRR